MAAASASDLDTSLSGVINEIIGLYPEMNKKDVQQLFKNKAGNEQKMDIPTKPKTELESCGQTSTDNSDTESTSTVVLSSDDEVVNRIHSIPKEITISKSTSVSPNHRVEDWLHYQTPAPVKFGRMRTFRTPSTGPAVGKKEDMESTRNENEFLASLSEIFVPAANYSRHKEAFQFINNFRKLKDVLVNRLFKIFNEHIFQKQLPDDLLCSWNVRLTKTAGFCKYTTENNRRIATIELSTKVCDNAERVRDTLIHELCHAAVWIIHGGRGGHDSTWKYWAHKAERVFPALPMIKRCHAYQIHAKYLYVCTTCFRQIRRHSKSLDTEKKACGLCHGRFELREDPAKGQDSATNSTPKPRQTPKFALFVKSNYSDVKGKKPSSSHAEIMRDLGEAFKKLDF